MTDNLHASGFRALSALSVVALCHPVTHSRASGAREVRDACDVIKGYLAPGETAENTSGSFRNMAASLIILAAKYPGTYRALMSGLFDPDSSGAADSIEGLKFLGRFLESMRGKPLYVLDGTGASPTIRRRKDAGQSTGTILTIGVLAAAATPRHVA
jgi:hypothetical protein